MGPKKEPPHKRRDSVMSLQPVQELWTACPCKTLCKVCDSSRVGSVRFIGLFIYRVSSDLYGLVADEPRCSSLLGLLLACPRGHEAPIIPLELCHCGVLAPFVAARISYLDFTQKKQATQLVLDAQRQRVTLRSGSPLPVVIFLVLFAMAYRNRRSRTPRVTEFFSL